MTTPEKVVRPEIQALKAYHVPPAAGLVKLDAMENPYGLPDALRRELAGVLARAELNRYPEPTPRRLIELIKRKTAVPEGMAVLLGNGSDELLQNIAITVAKPGASVLYPTPTFVMYSMYAAFFSMKAVGVPLREDFSFDREAFIARMRAENPAVVFIAYPNNPTGVLYPEADMEAVIRAAPGLVVMDEAYHAFALKSFMPRLAEFPNLVVVRTMSKLGLAGVRLGYMAGAPRWLEQFDKVRSPYNINVLTEAAAVFLLERMEVLEAQAADIRREREVLGRALTRLEGVTVYPSQANFFLVRVPDAARAWERLRAQGVLVKQLHPGLANCLRITVGTPEENRILLSALRESLQS
ncbi:MAG TPA: histidinol-phosphate transaminase [Burkholderiales bacterium]|nr:histidinol-phosphate transaminase [Burkholderiales bacterium]